MRYLILVLIVVSLGCQNKEATNHTSSKPDTISVAEDIYDEGETGCVHVPTEKKPENTPPFDKSDKIELVSYHARSDSYSNEQLIQNGKFTVPKIQQRIQLNKIQRDSLFSILYNFKKIRVGNAESVADCYNPHHSVVFYQEGRAIAFLEVCFLCTGSRQTKNLDFGEFCDEKWCTLQNFFKVNGADFGLYPERCQ